MEAPTRRQEDSIAEGIGAIRAAGGRVTPAKRLLLEIFAANTGHLSVEALTDLVQVSNPEVASSTVYRIVEELEVVGIVEHSHAGKGPATYHLRAAAHGHLICHVCGIMIEAPPSFYGQLVAEAKHAFGFEVDPHHFAVLGTCEDCLVTD
jgi:Fur family ferric uptake transcriptional regulator